MFIKHYLYDNEMNDIIYNTFSRKNNLFNIFIQIKQLINIFKKMMFKFHYVDKI